MKVFISTMLLFSSLIASAKAIYLFDGKNLKNVISEDFKQNASNLEGLGNLTLISSAPAVQVDFMIQAKIDTEIKIDGQSAHKLLSSESSQRFTFTYRRLDGEQKSIRIIGQEIIYWGNQARFSPHYFNGDIQNHKQKSTPIKIHFNQEIKITKLRITPITKFSIKDFFTMNSKTEDIFTNHTAKLYKNQCFECHGEKMMISQNNKKRPVNRILSSHAQLVKYIQNHRVLNDNKVHSLAWYINNNIFKDYHPQLYRTYSKRQWQKLPESLYTIAEHLEKQKGAQLLKQNLKADQGELVNQGEARFINGALEFWNDQQTWIKWEVEFTQVGFVEISIDQAFPFEDLAEYTVSIGLEEIKSKVVRTKDWTNFKTVELGSIYISEPGTYVVSVIPKSKPGIAVMNLRELKLSGLPLFNDYHKNVITVFHQQNENSSVIATNPVDKTKVEVEIITSKSSVSQNPQLNNDANTVKQTESSKINLLESQKEPEISVKPEENENIIFI